MKINEVMKETGLTKKAIYYYENERLIEPMKDPDNNYRNYTEEDVRRLIVINILRRMDVSIRSIRDSFSHSVPLREILKEQLVITNHKINLLIQNKIIMNDLIQMDVGGRDFPYKTLKQFCKDIGAVSAGAGRAGQELEQIFPGAVGRLFSGLYGNYLNVPLDTEEQQAAWCDLIKIIDEMKADDPADQADQADDPADPADVAAERPAMDPEPVSVKEEHSGYRKWDEGRETSSDAEKIKSFLQNNRDLFLKIDALVGIINEDYRSVGSILQ